MENDDYNVSIKVDDDGDIILEIHLSSRIIGLVLSKNAGSGWFYAERLNEYNIDDPDIASSGDILQSDVDRILEWARDRNFH